MVPNIPVCRTGRILYFLLASERPDPGNASVENQGPYQKRGKTQLSSMSDTICCRDRVNTRIRSWIYLDVFQQGEIDLT